MRSRRAASSLLALALLAGALPASAGFGIFKNRLTLPRTRPPEIPLLAESVALEVVAGGPEVEGAFVEDVRERLERALTAGDLYRLAERPREADARVRVTLERLRAEVRDELREEYRRVKVGERQEWNEKKKKYETKDVWADRRENVAWRVAEGGLTGEVRVEQRGREGGDQRLPLTANYGRDVKKSDGIPPEMSSEDELRRFLVAAVADQAVAAVAFGPDPVEALLATNGPLKPGNKLMEDDRPEQALASWQTLRLKGGDEAARRHNLGVAHEALAYRLAPFTPEHRAELEAAREHYQAARLLDAKEKYFAPPLERIEQSLAYADSAARLHEDLQRLRRERPARGRERDDDRRGRREERDEAPRTTRPPEPEARPRQGLSPSGGGLRNPGFEEALPPWTVTGKGTLASEDGHGRVLELTGAKAAAQASQPLTLALDEGAPAVLALLYRVTAGEPRLRVSVAYDDAQGKRRTSSLEVSNGEAPGGWSDWSHDLGTLRPRPAKLQGVTISVETGTVRLDDVTLD